MGDHAEPFTASLCCQSRPLSISPCRGTGAPKLNLAPGSSDSVSTWIEAELEETTVPLPPWAIRAGARETIYYNPAETNAAIVTCGGLCPGLNDVVQGLVNKLTQYGIPEGNILGIRCAWFATTPTHSLLSTSLTLLSPLPLFPSPASPLLLFLPPFVVPIGRPQGFGLLFLPFFPAFIFS